MIATAPSYALGLSIRRVALDDLPYVRNSWAEGHKGAPGVRQMSWRLYKQFVVPQLNAACAHPAVELVGAYIGSTIVGWLALSRGKRVNALHWVHTRFRIGESGEELRRRGIMTSLVDAAVLGNRIVYTWKGALGKHDHDGKTMDERLLPWLSSRGQHAAYLPWKEWIS